MKKTRFSSTITISVIIHALLLFGSPLNTKRDASKVYYAQNTSQRIQVRRLVQDKATPEVIKQELNKSKRAKKQLPKKLKRVASNPREAALRESLINSGVESIKAKYLSHIREQILANKHYPRIAKVLKKQGIVDIYFEVSYPRNLGNIKIQKGSGHEILDKSALSTIEALEDLPEMPATLKSETLKIAIPIKYELL